MRHFVLLSTAIVAFAFPAVAQKRVVTLATLATGDVAAEAYAKRGQAITMSADQIAAIVRSTIPDEGRDFTFQLFPDFAVTVTLFSPRVAEPGRIVLRGVVKNQQDSTVALAVREGEISGSIRFGTQNYQIRSNAGATAVYEMDLNAFPPEQEVDEKQSGLPVAVSANAVVSTATGPPVIDVMVVYTTKARTEMGSDAAMRAMIDVAIEETNFAYLNSGVTQQLRVVHTAEVAYDEDNLGGETSDKMFSIALSRLRATADGHMDEIHAQRDQHAADLVALLIRRTTISCGIGYVGAPPRDTIAFSVTDRVCGANLTLAHELGHNMGLMHDRLNSSSTGLTSYAYGFQEPEGAFRTIMAYAEGCTGGFCPRIPRFSNPDLTYAGRPTGIAADASNAAYAARALNDSALMVANLRGQTTAPAQLLTADSGTSTGYNPDTEQPVNRSSSFTATDERVWAFLKVNNFIGVHSVQRRWYSPDGTLYTTSTAAVVTGDGGSKYFSGNIAIAGATPATRLGNWKVEYLLDGAVVVSTGFTIREAVVHQPSSCVASTSTLCLQGNRFAVTIVGTFNGASAPGQSVPVNNQFGYFSIPGLTNDPSNAEVLVKIAGPVNGKYWVFYGGISGFEVSVTVKDMQTGVTKTYVKPLNTYNGGADFTSF